MPNGHTDQQPTASSTPQAQANLEAMTQWLAAAGSIIRAADLGERILQVESTPVELICSSLERAAEQLTKLKQVDPLLGAAQWMIEAVKDCTVNDLQLRLSIGYNRAARLFDQAHGRKAAPLQGDASDLSLSPDEQDPAVLWAAIWRMRAALTGPDGHATWQDAAVAEKVRRVQAEQAPQATQPSLHASLLKGRHVAVEAGALQLVRNVLKRDAEKGQRSRGEILEGLDLATFSLEDGVVVDTASKALEAESAHAHFKDLIGRLERSVHRMGELFNAHQGKGWPDAASEEFDRLRDERAPLLRRALLALFEQGQGADGSKAPAAMLVRWEQYRREIEDMEERMGSIAANFLRLKAWEDAAKCAIKAEGMRFVRGRMPQPDAVAQAELAEGASELDVSLIQRLMKLSDRLGISTEPGIENFSADLPSRLYAICRAVDCIFDRG